MGLTTRRLIVTPARRAKWRHEKPGNTWMGSPVLLSYVAHDRKLIIGALAMPAR